MYSGEYVCDVTLSYASASTPGKLKSLLGHGGNRTHDLWDTSLAEHWTSIPKVAGSIPTVAKQTFRLAR